MFEQNKNIKCPSCGAVLNVKNSKNEAVKLITCPQCKATLKVKFKEIKTIDAPTYYPGTSNGGETQLGGRQGGETQLGGGYSDSGETQLGGRQGGKTQLGGGYSDSGETQLGGRQGGETQLGGGYNGGGDTLLSSKQVAPKQAYLVVDGRKYPLAFGTNIVGRKAETSQATVQIDTSDRYMSRRHAKIVVTRLTGGKLKAVISNDLNKNISTIDGEDILQNDAIVLQNGDRIVMGKTTVTYIEQ